MEKQSIVKPSVAGTTNKSRWASVMTLGDMFDQTAESSVGDALVFPDERITYPELAELTNRYARALIGLGVERCEKVGILLPAGIDYIALLLAILKVGAVAVPVNARFKEIELRHVVSTTDMKVLFSSSDSKEFVDYCALLLNAFPGLSESIPGSADIKDAPEMTHFVCLSGEVPLGFLTRDAFEKAAEFVSDLDLTRRREMVRVRDTAVLLLTSGTTAQPKAAIISHEGLYRKVVTIRDEWWGLSSNDRIWTMLPLFHIGGLAYSILAFAAGAALCHGGFFNPEVSLRQLAEEKCTVALAAFETVWLAMLNQPAFPDLDLSSIRFVTLIGVPEQLQRMQGMLPNAPLISLYGSTESSPLLATNLMTDPLEVRLNTCGYAMPGMEMRIVDLDSGVVLGSGKRGELQYRGAGMFDGYYNDPELTRQVIDEHGWFRSGDLGELDQDGRLLFKGRLKDMLKVGGENVAALEIEGYLLGHPAIQIVQVVAAPDNRYVEVPAAYVQLKQGATLTEEELVDFCIGRIATFKVPRYVRFVNEWPMSGTKIQKYILRERIAEELRQAGITEAPKLQSRDARKLITLSSNKN